jgi:hypothetical protein
MKKVGIWIDHRRAVVVTIENGEESIKTIEGEVDHKPKAAGRSGNPTKYGPQATINEHRVEENYKLHVVNFYKDVIKTIGKPDELLVMGPAQAKLEFASELEKVSELRGIALKIETADKMTDPQIAAKVRATQF